MTARDANIRHKFTPPQTGLSQASHYCEQMYGTSRRDCENGEEKKKTGSKNSQHSREATIILFYNDPMKNVNQIDIVHLAICKKIMSKTLSKELRMLLAKIITLLGIGF